MDKKEACRLLNLALEPPPTIEQIKEARRKLALKYHPDHNPDGVAHDMFIAIDKACKFLTEPQPAPRPAPQPAAPHPASPASAVSEADMRKLQEVYEEIRGSGGYSELENVKSERLREVCAKNGIRLDCVSHASQRLIKKNKGELYRDIQKLPQFVALKGKSYDQLVALCQERQIPVTTTLRKKAATKSLTELILSLMAA